MSNFWLPEPFGDVVHGNHTYSFREGEWSEDADLIEIEGSFCFINGTIPMQGNIWIGGLPKVASTRKGLKLSQWQGIVLPSGYTELGGLIWAGDNKIQVNMFGSALPDSGIDGVHIGGLHPFSAFVNFKYRTNY